MHNAIKPAAMPSAVQEKLRSIRHRKICVAVVRAVAVSASVLMIAMVLAMLVDWAATLHAVGFRVIFTLSALAAAVIALIATAVPPLRDAARWTSLAAHADGEVPQLEERWTTIASMASSDRQPSTATERAMLQQVASEAVAIGRIVEPERVARPTELKPAAIFLGASSLLFAGFLALNWAQTSVLLQRFWFPTAAITATQLRSETGDVEIPRGETIDLVTKLTGLPRDSATLQVESGTEISDTFLLEPDEEQTDAFIHTMIVDSSFRYRVVSGDGRTDWHTVSAVDYPMLEEVQLTITAPSYVDRPPYEKQLIPHRVKVVQGSLLELRLKPDAPLENLALQLTFGGSGDADEPQRQSLDLTPDEDGWYSFQTQLLEDLSFRPVLRNRHGLSNQDRHQCRIEVIADRAPVARILSPTEEMAVANDDVIDIRFEAHDDHGIEMAELVVYDESLMEEGGEPRILHVQPIELGDQQNARHVMGETQLDLKKLGLEEGTQISYSVRVADNRNVDLDPETLASRIAEARQNAQQNGSPREAGAQGDADSQSTNDGATSPSDNEDGRSAENIENMLADAGSPRSEGSRTESSPAARGREPRDTGKTDDDPRPAADGAARDTESDMVAESASSPERSSDGDPATDAARVASSDADATPGSETGEPTESRRGASQDKANDSPMSTGNDDPSAVAANEPSDMKRPGEDSVARSSDADPSAAESERSGSKPGADAEMPRSEDPQNALAATDPREAASDAATSEPSSETATAPARNPEDDPTGAESGTETDSPVSDTPSQAVAQSETNAGSARPSGDSPMSDMPDADGTPDPETAGTENDIAAMTPSEANPNGTSSGNATPSDPRDGREEPRESESTPSERTADNALAEQTNQSSEGERQQNSNTGTSSQRMPTAPSRTSVDAPPVRVQVDFNPQVAESGQDTETVRRRLKITARLSAVAEATARSEERSGIRGRVVQIDELLAIAETSLRRLVDRQIPDADRSEQFRLLDQQLGDVETAIADLREETREHRFVFVGLQMAEIGRLHVTPARDRVFIGIREPLGSDNSSLALNHVIRAREMLAALLKRYDRVAQDEELAESLEETVEMYEVYVEKAHQLLREARQNRNPLSREMAVIEVDQAYLDRFAEVLKLRREVVAEFARMLSDDPRLLSRYLDLIRRRQNSLRDRLTELAERQDEIGMELSGWRQVDPAQQDNLWMIVAELRTHSATPLAKDAAELEERIDQSMPLQLNRDEGTAAQIIAHAHEIARLARQITFDVETFVVHPGEEGRPSLTHSAEELADLFNELFGALDQLDFEHEDEEITNYVTGRLLEARAVADQADLWARIASHLETRRFHGLAEVDQHQLAIATELLRTDMFEIEDELSTQFQQDLDSELPGEIVDMIRQLHRVMEALTMNQQAATFALSEDRLEAAEEQQALALDRFDEAEELFDRIRRAVIAALDEYDPPDPNIADLEDPTLDEFLAQLEREPNIQSQLGIPNRPRNLRVITDLIAVQQQAGGMLGQSEEAARSRARTAKKREETLNDDATPPNREMSEEERQQLAKAEDMKQMLEKSLQQIQEKAADPATSAEQRRRLEEMARNLQRMLEQMGQPNADADAWERIAESDRAKEVLQALARGEAIPEEQWNRLLSTLDDGLWQVRRRTPPEDYRKAIEQYQERIRQLTESL
ncbi:hypothetical protein Mal4_23850 [Maioricimonas rarisocia]|uniref:Uncharacterized protein n=1 Tax=Maioricimonas rarisocia TaxID=2528026 RepID=A0A517Z6H8_9PLAN|nr:hypothetical protein [Maioricimonas rarisocia]QDU38065.1 hypothetical protein Mal4_23850 [Maioricimonas rarisocia]